MKMRIRATAVISVMVAMVIASSAFSCKNFDRNTYQALSGSKAVIDQAAADYNTGTIPQTKQVYEIIAQARAAQDAAVKSFQSYLYIEAAVKAGKAGDINAAQTAVLDAINQVTVLVGQIHALYFKGGGPHG